MGGATACRKSQKTPHILATGFVSSVKPRCLPAFLVRGPGVAGEQAGSSSCGVGLSGCSSSRELGCIQPGSVEQPWGCSNALKHLPWEFITAFFTAFSLSLHRGSG